VLNAQEVRFRAATADTNPFRLAATGSTCDTPARESLGTDPSHCSALSAALRPISL